MPQVPYQAYPEGGVPDVPLRLDTPGAAFGVAGAEALKGVGKDISGVGNELWQSAVQMRQLEIESEVNKAVTKNLTESGDADNQFRLQTGGDPQRNLEAHVENLKSIRENNRASLSGPFAQKMFDRETMRRMGYDIVNAGNYAAANQRKYESDVRKGTQSALGDKLTSDPNNLRLQNDTMASLQRIEDADSDAEGIADKDLRDMKRKNALGPQIDKVAKVMANTDPDAAFAFLDRWKDYMHGAQYQVTLDTLRKRSVDVFAHNEGARIASGPPLEQARRVIKQIESGGEKDPYRATTTTKAGTALGAYQVMENELPEWSKAALGRVVSRDEFLNSPEIQDAIFDHRFGMYLQKYGARGAGEAWYGGEGKVGKDSQATDAFGRITVADYGRRVAAAVTSPIGGDYGLQQQHEAAEESGDRLAKKYNWDPTTKQDFIDKTISNIDKRANVQKKADADRVRTLNVDIGQTMIQNMPSGRRPTSTAEATQVDRSFPDKVEELERRTPGFARKLEGWFKANSKQDVPWSVERESNFAKFLGATDEERMQYRPEEMFNKGDITQKHFDRMMEMQAGIHRKTQMGYLIDPILVRNHQALNDAEAYPSKTNLRANERYKWLRGAAQLRMEDHLQKTQSPMNYKEQEDMMKSLLEEVTTGKYDWYNPAGWFGGAPQDRRFTLEGQPPVQLNSAADYNSVPSGRYYIYNGQLAGPKR